MSGKLTSAKLLHSSSQSCGENSFYWSLYSFNYNLQWNSLQFFRRDLRRTKRRIHGRPNISRTIWNFLSLSHEIFDGCCNFSKFNQKKLSFGRFWKVEVLISLLGDYEHILQSLFPKYFQSISKIILTAIRHVGDYLGAWRASSASIAPCSSSSLIETAADCLR